jgi:hypothetical protein
MSFPHPEPGLVISCSYLWRHESEAGREEGRKARPCVIILAAEQKDSGMVVTVASVTHSPPGNAVCATEIPPAVKRMLGLDAERSWAILNEVNIFTWPGHDLQPVPGKKDRYDYGFLPPHLFEKIKNGILDLIVTGRTKVVNRD